MTEPMIELLDAVWHDLADLCEGLTDEEWELPTECPGWTVKDNIAHMIGTERMLLGEQPEPADVSGAKHVKNEIGKANETWIEGYRAQPGREVLDEFRAVTALRLAALRALSTDDWDREGFTPEGPGPYRQFMAIRVFDCWYHDQDIREALDRPGFLEGAVADLSVERIGTKGLGYIVGKKASAPPNSTAVFDVLGSPEITVVVRVPPEGRATVGDDVPSKPTVRIAVDRRSYARLAGGRWTGADARTQGSVRITGDEDLGNRIVDNMAFTI